ncbi:hypothetical protein H6P81_008922 [Aristolochia fimbriata]|uniref:Uncharacterized protein n=1 Tax=Aristolochia fimbriata TaxID=158543 RepID=A0AAV7EJC8_ARIFI|nr:hypothetical protein H6P81_008922 [Aristolochia fimbriata]
MEGSVGTPSSKRPRVDSDEFQESPQAKRIRDDLLDILDDVEDRNSETQDLVYVMKSFEEEIALPPPASDSGDSQPELGFLFEASDDELGLPPTSTESGKVEEDRGILTEPPTVAGLGQIWGFDDDLPAYDAFGVYTERDYNGDGDVVFEGLFDYSDGVCAPASDFSDFSWRTESLPAL